LLILRKEIKLIEKKRTNDNRIQLEGKWTDRKGLEERRKII
jgi:hypothetical protein